MPQAPLKGMQPAFQDCPGILLQTPLPTAAAPGRQKVTSSDKPF